MRRHAKATPTTVESPSAGGHVLTRVVVAFALVLAALLAPASAHADSYEAAGTFLSTNIPGVFASAGGLAVNDTTGDLYVGAATGPGGEAPGAIYRHDADGAILQGANEIQQLALDATGGTFSLTFEGQTTGGTGTGTLAAGSVEVTEVVTATGALTVGEAITGTGIPAGTVISSVEGSTLKLSQKATASGSGVSLTSALPYSPAFVGATGTGKTEAGSPTITEVLVDSGAFVSGATISGPGIPAGTTIQSAGGGEIVLSQNATATATGVALVANRPPAVTGEVVGEALRGLSNLEASDISAGGPPSAINITFTGAYTGIDVAQITTNSAGLTGGASTATVTTTQQGSAPIAGTPEGGTIVGQGFFAGLAINQASQNLFAFNAIDLSTFEEGEIRSFTSTGTPIGTPFEVNTFFGEASPPDLYQQIAVDSSGNVYYPNQEANSVQKFSSTGTLLDTITGFTEPSNVALDGAGNIYVVDKASFITGTEGRLQKFDSTGEPAACPEAVCNADTEISAIAVDTGSGNILVGKGLGDTFHIVAYDSTGSEVSDFGFGEFSGTPPTLSFNRIAVNANTGRVYATEWSGQVRIYDLLPSPEATGITPSPIGTTTVTLKGEVNPNGQATSCQFRYGTTAAYGSTAPCSPTPGEGTSPVAVSAAITGLSPNTEYHFSIRAISGAGTTDSTDMTFKTAAAPPAVVTGSASGISQTAATAAGTVNPNGANVTDCHIEYGTTVAYGSQKACASLPGAGSSPVAVSAALSALSANTLYHYRVVATSAGGTTNGSDATFTTLANTCATDSSLCPPPSSGGGGGGGTTPPPPPSDGRNEAAYKVCVKKATASYKKALKKAKGKAAKKAALKKKQKAIKKCASQFR